MAKIVSIRFNDGEAAELDLRRGDIGISEYIKSVVFGSQGENINSSSFADLDSKKSVEVTNENHLVRGLSEQDLVKIFEKLRPAFADIAGSLSEGFAEMRDRLDGSGTNGSIEISVKDIPRLADPVEDAKNFIVNLQKKKGLSPVDLGIVESEVAEGFDVPEMIMGAKVSLRERVEKWFRWKSGVDEFEEINYMGKQELEREISKWEMNEANEIMFTLDSQIPQKKETRGLSSEEIRALLKRDGAGEKEIREEKGFKPIPRGSSTWNKPQKVSQDKGKK